MDFKQLKSFAAVVEYLSFTKAAEHLFVSQPTISAHVRTLEDELGCRLIVRTTKSIEITEKGREVYECVSGILAIKEKMHKLCVRQDQRLVRIGASTIPSAYILPEILPAFGRLYPHIYFNIHHIDSTDVIEGVCDGRFDLGFAAKTGDERVMSLSVWKDRMVMITPVTDLYLAMNQQQTMSVEQMIAQPMIMREKKGSTRKQADRYLEALGIDEGKLNVVARVNDQEAVKNMVSRGMGISLISWRAAKDFVDAKRLLQFELPVRWEKNIYLISRKTEKTSDHIAHFVRFIRENALHGDE